MTGTAAEGAVVTVGIPAHDSARTLRRAVESVLAQDERRWVLRIADDRSADGTWDLCRTLAQADGRIAVTRAPERRGFMNFGDLLASARTPYFVWLAADDHWAPTFLSRCLDALAARPDAVSALPRCAFLDGGAPPSTATLDGPPADRIRRFLARPGGTRMYGLARTDVLRASFPPRVMNAYDWYLMLGLLGRGPQVEVPEVLLFREPTHWMRYAEVVDEIYRNPLWRRFPILDMSLAAWRAGFVPPGTRRALAALNLRKHEEYLAITRPRAFGRSAWLLRRLGLPIASRPGHLAAIASEVARRDPRRRAAALALLRREAARGQAASAAALARIEGGAPAAPAVARAALPPLTAVLACRNGAATLPRLLDHLERTGARVVVIDHASTDATRRIAEDRRGRPVAEILDEPFDGTFDLSRQLALKRSVIATVRAGWVIHADADEFLDPPPGRTLRAVAARAEAEGRLAVPCREFLFLPGTEAERHSPESFEDTLCTYVPLAERDPKQRLFRHDAPLGLWEATGGHTVTRDPARIAPEALDLRHYFGLSLADIRAQYYGRVFAERDLAKRWHGGRRASAGFDVVAPAPGLLRDRAAGLDPSDPLRLPPVFVAAAPPPPPEDGPADLVLLAAPGRARDEVARRLGGAAGGLRLRPVADPAEAPARPSPVLHLIEHPGAVAAASPDPAAAAAAWVRRIARARQAALRPGPAYLEMRIEDGCGPDRIAAAVAAALRGDGPRGRDGYLPRTLPVRPGPWPDGTRRTAGPLAADLGYG